MHFVKNRKRPIHHESGKNNDRDIYKINTGLEIQPIILVRYQFQKTFSSVLVFYGFELFHIWFGLKERWFWKAAETRNEINNRTIIIRIEIIIPAVNGFIKRKEEKKKENESYRVQLNNFS